MGSLRNTWEQVWDLVTRVDRPNFGINLDTFQILGTSTISVSFLTFHHTCVTEAPGPARAWADVASTTSTDRTHPDAEERLRASLDSLTEKLSGPKAHEKIVYLQISDGSRAVGAGNLLKAAKEVTLPRSYAYTGTYGLCAGGERDDWQAGHSPVVQVVRRVAAASRGGFRHGRQRGAARRVPTRTARVRGGAADGVARAVEL
jgi:hypothetical protein